MPCGGFPYCVSCVCVLRAQVYDGPSTVLMALASRRHGPDSLPRLEETEEQPGSDDEADEGPLTKQPPYFGYQMRALAVHTVGDWMGG